MSLVRRSTVRHLSVGVWQSELARPRHEIWSWASDIESLNALTPPWFVLTPTLPPPTLRLGAEIDYRFRWRFLETCWRSRIVAWEPYRCFAYEQVRGPFRYFRHEHRFEVADGGTRMSDRVVYRARGGRLVDRLLVAPDLDRVFAHRRVVLERLTRREPEGSAPGGRSVAGGVGGEDKTLCDRLELRHGGADP